MRKTFFIIIFFVLLCNSAIVLAQTEPEEIKLDSDKFQDYFYESLLQKGIENYDKAIVALENCLTIKPNDATIYFEIGKNQLALKDYRNAYFSFEKATQIDSKNKWFWVGMYDVNYKTNDYNQAIITINKLIEFDPKYKEDLVSLYMNSRQFDKALALINELNDSIGKTEKREFYKSQILSEGKYQNAEIANLISQINKNPKEESNYLTLIHLYTVGNQEEKANEIEKKLEVEIPTSIWAQASAFKNYLDKNDAPKAINTMNNVLASSKIDSKIKHRMLNEFLIYVNKNPQYSADLEKAISFFDTDKEVNVSKEIGKYYYNKKQWERAIYYFEQDLKKNSSPDIETNLLLIEAYIETKKPEFAARKATEMIEIFPSQPQFYYYSGKSNNQLKQFKNAKEILEMGLDYLVDDIPLEINFNNQLSEAYNGLGDIKNKEKYLMKANQLLKKQ
ncbi:tetratricopeptide repeat protein [Flavobacterium sp.]|uniref:tetratricopeptide repeat protein n=1 Tax=Flavobacterium sp. TaxID=239 RepID=UPI00286B0287|nr:tetratricopeptide repeat protein [Flavobacterium sp.]